MLFLICTFVHAKWQPKYFRRAIDLKNPKDQFLFHLEDKQNSEPLHVKEQTVKTPPYLNFSKCPKKVF